MIPDLPSLTKIALEHGGSIHPLILPAEITGGTGLMNPSIYLDHSVHKNGTGKLMVNLRHVNYTFYHSEKKLFQHQYGPLTYVHPENDMHLVTKNYYCELSNELDITRYSAIDTSQFDTYEPQWDFVGLEDARLFRWGGKLFTCGVRRDTTPNGVGRMELCEIEVTDEGVKEVSRFRIPPPNDPSSYCEKNWMPILDKPYHFVKWGNPTEVVKVELDYDSGTALCKTVHLSPAIDLPRDLRGGSQVLPIQTGYVALMHEVMLFNSEVGRKDAVYRHRFILWDHELNIRKYSRDFDLMGGHVEFCTGMAYFNGHVLISFGFQDNAAFILKIPVGVLDNFIAGQYDVQ